jgi:hypothetical protein
MFSAAAPSSVITSLLSGQLERFRESFPSTVTAVTSPICHLTYWHTRLLINRTGPQDDPNELLQLATEVVKLLAGNPTLITPLTHHFTSLAAMTLVDLLDTEFTRDGAEHYIKIIMDSRIAPSGWDSVIREMIAKKAASTAAGISTAAVTGAASQHALTASQGLQHLADLATATEAGRSEVLSEAIAEKAITASHGAGSQPWESPSITKVGYLNLLAGEAGR